MTKRKLRMSAATIITGVAMRTDVVPAAPGSSPAWPSTALISQLVVFR